MNIADPKYSDVASNFNTIITLYAMLGRVHESWNIGAKWIEEILGYRWCVVGKTLWIPSARICLGHTKVGKQL